MYFINMFDKTFKTWVLINDDMWTRRDLQKCIIPHAYKKFAFELC